jgi:O-antigen/teichoic acid export membrane protein
VIERKRTYGAAVPGRLLARNTLINMAGYGVPLLVAFFTVPALLKGMGTERFGILTLAWMVVGYFGLFDLGMGRATTKFVAEALAKGEYDAAPRLIWTSLGMLAGLGLTGGLVLAATAPYLVTRVLNIPGTLHDETVLSFTILAASVPLVLGTAATRGTLEAQQRFGLVNAVRIPMSAAFFAAPLLVLPYSPSLVPVAAMLLIVRFVEFVTYTLFCLYTIPGMKHPQLPEKALVKKLLGFGGWLTVTNVISPFMNYMDRFVIGSMLPITAVAYYSTSYDFVTRLGIVAGSLMGVVFPALTASSAIAPDRIAGLIERSVKSLLLLLTPAALLLIVFAEPFLNLWVGHDFAVNSASVFQILAIGILLNSLAQVPFTAIQAMGRPDITSKLHLLELPFYLACLWFFVMRWGITGAAAAWLLRVVVDTLVLWMLADRMKPDSSVKKVSFIPVVAMISLSLCVTAYLSGRLGSAAQRVVFGCSYLSVFLAAYWLLLLSIDERKALSDLRSGAIRKFRI